MDDVTAGISGGGTIHDVAQWLVRVIRCREAGNIATLTKLVRVAMLGRGFSHLICVTALCIKYNKTSVARLMPVLMLRGVFPNYPPF